MRYALLLVSLLLFSLSVGTMTQAKGTGPSFNCSQARSKAELLVCSKNEIAELDLALNQVYRDALAVSPDRADVVKKQQRAWLSQRDHACSLDIMPISPDPENKLFGCMLRLYTDRLHAVIVQNLDPVLQSAIHNPRDALARLQPLRSPLAVVYTDLLTHALSTESIKDFSDFTEALALRHQGEDSELHPFTPISMPCELVERYPRLLLVSRPYFGSSLDAFLPKITCGDSYNTYPAAVGSFLKTNKKTVEASDDRCMVDFSGGTMIHALASDEWLHELRIAYFPRSYLTDTMTFTDTPEEPWPSQQTLTSSDWNSDRQFLRARDALADYYHRKFDLTSADAATAATRALWDNRSKAENPDQCG
jgi:uncharacterized protein YecT (DUF1311 family)